MKDFQKRVLVEKTELDEKIQALTAFANSDAFKTLPADEQVRLHRQMRMMTGYSDVLAERISAFTEGK